MIDKAGLIAMTVMELRLKNIDVTNSIEKSISDSKPMIVVYYWETEHLQNMATGAKSERRVIAKSFYIKEDEHDKYSECIQFLHSLEKVEEAICQ